MPSIPHIKVDQPITADLLNRIADRLEPWSKMTVAQGSHLNFMTGPFGKALVLMLPREIPSRLIGDSSPYAWTALTEEADGAYADRTGGLLGGEAAYEINGKAGLDGKVAMLRWTAAGDWRFQWVGYGPPPPCEAGRICVTVQQSSCTFDLEGVTVTVTDDAEPPNEIGSGTASGSPATFCVDIPEAGTYHVKASVPGVTDQTATVNAVCGIDNGVTLTFPPKSVQKVCITFNSCDGNTTGPAAGSATLSGSGWSLGVTLPGGEACTFVPYSSGFTTTITGVTGKASPAYPDSNYLFDTPYNEFCPVLRGTFFSVTGSYVHAFGNSGAAPGCSGSVEIRKEDEVSTIGTGTIDLVFDGVGYTGQTLIPFTEEIFQGEFNNYSLFTVWPQPEWSYSGGQNGRRTFGCYGINTSMLVYGADGGSGGPCHFP